MQIPKQKKILFSILCIVTLLMATFATKPFTPVAYAWWGVLDFSSDVPVTGTTAGGMVGSIGGFGATVGNGVKDALRKLAEIAVNSGVTIAKVAAVATVQFMTSKMIGDGSGLIIRDWDQYLNVAPKQKALEQMNSWYSTVSKGRRSSLNYEGVTGKTLDSYFTSQSEKTIRGDAMETNIQEYIPDPKKDMFSTGNMQGIMLYTQCGNNPACYTLTAEATFEEYVNKNRETAKSEQQNGILPQKIDGRILKPAGLVNEALLQLDKMGTDMIVQAEADNPSAYSQILAGTALSVGSRWANYKISDNDGKAAMVNQAKSYPFSLKYNSKTNRVDMKN